MARIADLPLIRGRLAGQLKYTKRSTKAFIRAEGPYQYTGVPNTRSSLPESRGYTPFMSSAFGQVRPLQQA